MPRTNGVSLFFSSLPGFEGGGAKAQAHRREASEGHAAKNPCTLWPLLGLWACGPAGASDQAFCAQKAVQPYCFTAMPDQLGALRSPKGPEQALSFVPSPTVCKPKKHATLSRIAKQGAMKTICKTAGGASNSKALQGSRSGFRVGRHGSENHPAIVADMPRELLEISCCSRMVFDVVGFCCRVSWFLL